MSSNNKPAGFTPGPRHKVFGISDDLLKTTRAILMGEKPEVQEPDEETAEKQEDLSEKSITVSMHSSGTKYKVHSVHKSIAGQIKPGEHLSDTHIDDLKDSGIKVNHVKSKPTPKTAKPAVMGYRKEALSHNCANHVKSEQWGDGQCIPGMHTLEEVDHQKHIEAGRTYYPHEVPVTAKDPSGHNPVHSKKLQSALAHSSEEYKVNYSHGGGNHSSDIQGKKPPHAKPDVTHHIEHGDNEVSGYTVHHDGAAAKDPKLHHKAMHVEGIVTHYDVMFEHGIEQNVPVEDLEIVSERHHSHKKSMKEDDDNGNGNDDENGDDNGNGKSKKKSKKSKKLDKVDPDELEGSHDERDDEDIDNDDDVDASDKYLHKRRKAVHKAIKKEDTDRDPSGKRFNPAAAKTKPKPSPHTLGRDPSGRRYNPAAAKTKPSPKKVLDILALNRKHY